MNACQSHQPGSMTCRDGFVQRPFCSGHAGCVACGHISGKALPPCLQGEIPAHLSNDDGSPLFWSAVR